MYNERGIDRVIKRGERPREVIGREDKWTIKKLGDREDKDRERRRRGKRASKERIQRK